MCGELMDVSSVCANCSFAPLGLVGFHLSSPRLTPWAAILRRFAAMTPLKSGPRPKFQNQVSKITINSSSADGSSPGTYTPTMRVFMMCSQHGPLLLTTKYWLSTLAATADGGT